jgi:hypothetical protein
VFPEPPIEGLGTRHVFVAKTATETGFALWMRRARGSVPALSKGHPIVPNPACGGQLRQISALFRNAWTPNALV